MFPFVGLEPLLPTFEFRLVPQSCEGCEDFALTAVAGSPRGREVGDCSQKVDRRRTTAQKIGGLLVPEDASYLRLHVVPLPVCELLESCKPFQVPVLWIFAGVYEDRPCSQGIE